MAEKPHNISKQLQDVLDSLQQVISQAEKLLAKMPASDATSVEVSEGVFIRFIDKKFAIERKPTERKSTGETMTFQSQPIKLKLEIAMRIPAFIAAVRNGEAEIIDKTELAIQLIQSAISSPAEDTSADDTGSTEPNDADQNSDDSNDTSNETTQ